MKNLYSTLLFLFVFGTFASAQTTFALTTDTVVGTAEVPEITAAASDSVTNLMNNAITMNWTRTILNISYGCVIQVCDPNNCYLPTVSTKNFTIQANHAGSMMVDLVDTLLSGNPASAVVRIKYTNIGMTSDTASTYYFMSITAATGVSDPSFVRVVLFPNPVAESFTLKSDDVFRTMRVYNLSGQQVAEYTATPDQRYSLAGQPAGAYLVGLFDENGRVLHACQVLKQ